MMAPLPHNLFVSGRQSPPIATHQRVFIPPLNSTHTPAYLLLTMSSLPELPGAPYAVGMFPEFTNHQNTVALKIKGKTVSLTGGDYAIVDAINLVPYFKVSSKSFSMSGRKGE
jgi:hypothetical protein